MHLITARRNTLLFSRLSQPLRGLLPSLWLILRAPALVARPPLGQICQPRHRSSTLLTFGLLATLLAGCAPSLEDLQNTAQTALDNGDFESAHNLSEEAISEAAARGDATPRQIWAFERIGVEALARQKEMGKQASRTLERLAAEYPPQITAAFYLVIASYVQDAGDSMNALDILDSGVRRFPEQSEKFLAAIEQLKTATADDPAVLERLRSLGYIN